MSESAPSPSTFTEGVFNLPFCGCIDKNEHRRLGKCYAHVREVGDKCGHCKNEHPKWFS